MLDGLSPIATLLIVMLVSALLIGVNAFFVVAEFSTVAARRTRVEPLAEKNRRARSLLPILSSPARLDRYVATCQVGITISSLALGSFGQGTLGALLAGALVGLAWFNETTAATVAAIGALILLTIVQIAFGESAPKAVAMRFPERVAMATVGAMRISARILGPFVRLFNGSSALVLRALRIADAPAHARAYAPEEIELLAGESTLAGKLQAHERDLLAAAFDLSQLKARQVMIPRNRVLMADVEAPIERMMRTLVDSRFSRMPVYRESPDNVIGLVHVKDLFRLQRAGESRAEGIVRPVAAFPENTAVRDVWAELTGRRRYMAVILDEYGGTAGIVTQEDLIEEIVGEVQDEFDRETPLLRRLEDGTVLVRGDLQVQDVNDSLDLALPTDEADTIGGLVMAAAGRIVSPGERVTVAGTCLEAAVVRRRWVARVMIRTDAPCAPEGEARQGGMSEEGA